MIIRKSQFNNGGEVDITSNFGGGTMSAGRGRISIRRSEDNYNTYEVYVFWFITKKEEVLCKGTLFQCVEFTNAYVGLNDIAEDK